MKLRDGQASELNIIRCHRPQLSAIIHILYSVIYVSYVGAMSLYGRFDKLSPLYPRRQHTPNFQTAKFNLGTALCWSMLGWLNLCVDTEGYMGERHAGQTVDQCLWDGLSLSHTQHITCTCLGVSLDFIGRWRNILVEWSSSS